jgi:hypothetical protein
MPWQILQIPVIKSSKKVGAEKREKLFPGRTVIATSDALATLLADAGRQFGKDALAWEPTGEMVLAHTSNRIYSLASTWSSAHGSYYH